MLRDGDSTPEVVAAHLLCARPVDDPEATRTTVAPAATSTPYQTAGRAAPDQLGSFVGDL
jgi:hypothetical protein